MNHYFKNQQLQFPPAPDGLVDHQTFVPKIAPPPSETTLVEWGLSSKIAEIQNLFAQFPDRYSEATYTRWVDRLISDFRFDDDLRLYEFNAQLFPKSAEIWMALANAYVLFDRKSDAKATLQQLLSIQPGYEAAIRLLQEIN